VQLNQKLHSNNLYNTFQIGVSALAMVTGGFSIGMKNPVCFVAGTVVLTAVGLVAIENLKAGDKVISTKPETGDTLEKAIIETYIRKSTLLIHLWIEGEKTSVTPNHPYWVSKKGWVSAGNLVAEDQLRKLDGNWVPIQKVEFEELDTPVTVYNFEVEDFHTYYVGNISVLVHNANCKYTVSDDGTIKMTDWGDYPENMPKPNGPVKILEGDAYKTARNQANSVNRAIHKADPFLADKQIHEIQPVNWSGSPTDISNKIPLSHSDHVQVTKWWQQLKRQVKNQQ
jgi:hypothetical protein